jgi:hypothetical protein
MARVTGSRIAKLRAHWAPKVDAGDVVCRRCHEPIRPGQDWDLGHDHDLALGGNAKGRMVPEHRHPTGSCPGNRSAGATLGNQLRHRPRRRLSEWLA